MSDRFSMAILSYVIRCRKAIKSSQFAKYHETAGPQNLSDLVIDTFSIKKVSLFLFRSKSFSSYDDHIFCACISLRKWPHACEHSKSHTLHWLYIVGFSSNIFMRLPTWLKLLQSNSGQHAAGYRIILVYIVGLFHLLLYKSEKSITYNRTVS